MGPLTIHTSLEIAKQLDALRNQLVETKEKHQSEAEEFEATNEELRVALAELELGKAEFELITEKLTATNRQLQDKIEELAQANGDLQNLMAATAIATVFLDRQLRITRYTPAATAIFPLVAGDVGRPLAHLRHRLDYAEFEADIAQVLDQLCLVEREVAGNNGEWFLLRLLPCRIGEEITGVVLTCVDITERKQVEERRQAQEAAERLHRARNEFLSRMSHELRTPLNAILGFGQVLELSSHDDQDKLPISLILKAGRHLLSLVDEVLDLTQAEAGKLPLTFAQVDLERITRECLLLTAKLAETRQIGCEAVKSQEPPLTLWTDEQRLRQILLNLLTNAIKYNRPGGQVVVSCHREEDGQCLISVQDTGFGIAADDLSRLFAPFERLHQNHGEIEGTGLGLAITRRLIEALGGDIGVESTLGRGSRFWIKLPLAALRF